QQQRPHFGDGGTHRMSLLAKHVPEYGRELVGLEGQAHLGRALDDKILWLADFRYARQIALDISREHGNAGARKTLRHHLQRDCLPGAGRTGDEAMAVRKRKREPGCLLALANEDLLTGIRHMIGCYHRAPPSSSLCGPDRSYFILHCD